MSTTHTNGAVPALGRAALAYAERLGWPVLPCEPGGKAPLGPLVPHGLRDATTDPETIRRWWQDRPNANVAVLPPPGILVLDLDEPRLATELLGEYPALRHAPRQQTPRGGCHIVASVPEDLHLPTRAGALPGLDLRGMGRAYVVAAPSRTEQGAYRWIVRPRPGEPPPACPPALLERLGAARRRPERTTPAAGSEDETIPAGRRNATLAAHAGALRRQGLGQEAIEAALLGINARACRPPLDEEEVIRIARSVVRYEPETTVSAILAEVVKNLPRPDDVAACLPPETPPEPPERPQEPRSPEVLPDVRHLLPPPLRAALDDLRTEGERAAFLTAALAVASAALGRVSILYGGREHTPALMTLVVGPAGAGKGGATLAARLLDDIDERLRRASEEARADWERRRREASETGEDPPPEPPMQYVVASESTSEAALTRALADNPDGVLLFSSEADSLTAALRQEWGAFSHLLRKGFHHEPHRRETRSGGLIVCERVVLSLALAGTPAQLDRLIEGGVENGLYSRFLIATIHDPPRWVSQRPRPGDERLRAALEALRGCLTEVWEALRTRDMPLRLDLTPDMWDKLDDAFEDLHGRVVEAAARGQAPDALAAVVKRAALSTVRIAAVLTCIEAPARGVRLDRADRIEAAPEAFEAALTLGLSYARQTLALASRALRETLEADDVVRRALAVLETLPETFETSDYEAAAVAAGVTDRTARRWLERLEAEGLLHSPRRGVYERHERPAAL
ncbi:DUF3987 domain-containing protein [Rhodocaloribacter litoris]|uniref:DUF3987 domain-containing protein n=1 Tax=Rhodocaloribacter litoris TaxID=2558931 RepID=UPI00141F4EE5|nr:DUF3987 domain-containing protein [Rhodocaloribacter litoris]QXD16987.1 DUF3987 domain-containing protein [Rhodocaloribacter litoris]